MSSFDPALLLRILRILQEPNGPPLTVKELKKGYKHYIRQQDAMTTAWSVLSGVHLISEGITGPYTTSNPDESFTNDADSAEFTVSSLKGELLSIESDIDRLAPLVDGWNSLAGIARSFLLGDASFKMSNLARGGEVVTLPEEECETDENGITRPTYSVSPDDLRLVTEHLVARQGYIKAVLEDWAESDQATLAQAAALFDRATTAALDELWTALTEKAKQAEEDDDTLE